MPPRPPIVVRELEVPEQGGGGNRYRGVATPRRGATELVLARAAKDPGAVSVAHAHDREEVILVLAGRARATVDGATVELGPGDTLIVPAGAVHQVANPGPDVFECVLAKPAGIGFLSPSGEAMPTPDWML